MIKVDSIRNSSQIKKKKTVKTDDHSFDDLLNEVINTKSSAIITQIDPLSPISLFDNKANEHADEETAKQLAEQILNRLNSLKLDLLKGNISMQNLNELTSITSKTRELFLSPALKEIIQDIEMRALVEIAKIK